MNRDDHPLQALVDDEKYNRAGKGLYGTLGSFLHAYGRLRIDPLSISYGCVKGEYVVRGSLLVGTREGRAVRACVIT
jgi:hypothetical protein